MPFGNIGEIKQFSFSIKRHLSSCEYFDVCYYGLTGKTDFHSNDRFISLLVIEGEITVSYYGGSISAQKGTDVFIPKGLSVGVCGNDEIICSECK